MNKKNIFIVAICVFLLAAAGFYIVNGDKGNDASGETITMSAQIEAVGGQLIDVREPDEYTTDHANGAINIPLGDILNGDFSRIDINKPVYLYCRTGNRAGQAKTALEQAGYKNVTNLGGLSDWQNQGGLACKSTEPNC